MRNGVLILAGPTASGKTALAIELAQRFDAEIVSADSRQIYRGMPIGTAAPTAEQLATVPHHLVGFLDPYERYSAARFAQDAMAAIEDIHTRGKHAAVVGGTGFYIRALCGGVELAPEYDAALRARLAHEAQLHSPEFMYEWLESRDPRRSKMLHAHDRYRVLRALEVVLSPVTARLRVGKVASLVASGVPFIKTFLSPDDETLDARIEQRTDAMLRTGLLEEAERIGGDAVAASAVGYPQALAYLHGWSTQSELRAQLVRSTRRYAKRQFTWFRSEPDVEWIALADAPVQLARLAREKLRWVERA